MLEDAVMLMPRLLRAPSIDATATSLPSLSSSLTPTLPPSSTCLIFVSAHSSTPSNATTRTY